MLGMGGGVGSSLVSGGGVEPEDVFSIDEYTGNDTSKTIDNGIDLSGEGGFVIIKRADSTAQTSKIFDTARGTGKYITFQVPAQVTDSATLTSFNSNGFTVGSDTLVNTNLGEYLAVTFREFEGFMDIISWAGNATNRTISHSLGVKPEFMMIKNYGPFTETFIAYHKAIGATKFLQLSGREAAETRTDCFNDTEPTSSVITVGTGDKTNRNGHNIVAYLFASLSGFCKVGSYTGSGSTQNIDCSDMFTGGPRFVIIKNTSLGSTAWNFFYSIVDGNDKYFENDSAGQVKAVETADDDIDPLSSGGFTINGAANDLNRNGDTFMFVAIK